MSLVRSMVGVLADDDYLDLIQRSVIQRGKCIGCRWVYLVRFSTIETPRVEQKLQIVWFDLSPVTLHRTYRWAATKSANLAKDGVVECTFRMSFHVVWSPSLAGSFK